MTTPSRRSYPQPLLGRDREKDILTAMLDDAIAGRGGLALISGEPGIGKTRLAGEVANEALDRAVGVHWGHCFEWAGTPAYWPWIEVLRDLIESSDPDDLRCHLGQNAALIAQIVPELEEVIPELPSVPEMNPEQARFRLFDAISRYLRSTVRETPLLVVLDDLHWADAGSLLLLEFLARDLHESSIVIIGTYRDADVGRDHPLAATIASLIRVRATQQLSLANLAREHVIEVIRYFAETEPSTRAADAVFAATAGNPLFVTEVVRQLLDHWRLEEPGTDHGLHVAIPESIREVIRDGLGRLSEHSANVLSIAAVIGQEFDLAILQRASGLSLDEVLTSIDEAIEARLVEARQRVGHYRFTHVLIQDTLYEDLSASGRLRWHGWVGEAIEQEYGSNLAPHFGDLARHFRLSPFGANLDKAIDYAIQAGDQAMAQVAWESAAGHYQRAVELREDRGDATPEPLCEMLLKLGDAQARAGASRGTHPGAGNDPVTRATFRKAARLARDAGLFDHAARAFLGMSGMNRSARPHGEESDQLDRIMFDTCDSMYAEDGPLRARVLAWMSRHAFLRSPAGLEGYEAILWLQRAIEWSEESIAMARRLDDPATIAFALHLRPMYYQEPVDAWLEEQLETTAELLDYAHRADDQVMVAWGLLDSYYLRSELDGKDSAADVFTQLGDVASSLRMPLFEWHVAILRVAEALEKGRYDDAKRLLEETEESWSHSLVAMYQRFMLHRERENRVGMAEELARYVYGPDMLILPLKLVYAVDSDGRNETRSLLDSSGMEALLKSPPVPWKARWLTLIAEVCAEVDDAVLAKVIYEDLQRYARLGIGSGFHDQSGGCVSSYLGLLATTLGRWDEAAQHFAHGLELNNRWGCRPFAAYTRHWWADMLLRRGEAGDRERAREFLADAKATAREIGMVRLQRLIRDLELRARFRAQTGAGGLSPRELEVLRLLVEGQSDREIGEELYISHHTVMRHVSSILRKLDVDSRGAAAVHAVRNGLV